GAARSGRVEIEAEDGDEIETRPPRPPAPAKLPQGQDRGLLPCDAPVQLREMLIDRAVQAADERTRQPGESLARLFRRHGSRHDPRPDQEHLLLREDTDAIEEVLVRPSLTERS